MPWTWEALGLWITCLSILLSISLNNCQCSTLCVAFSIFCLHVLTIHSLSIANERLIAKRLEQVSMVVDNGLGLGLCFFLMIWPRPKLSALAFFCPSAVIHSPSLAICTLIFLTHVIHRLGPGAMISRPRQAAPMQDLLYSPISIDDINHIIM